MNEIEAMNQMMSEMENNAFIKHPFQPLKIDLARYNPDEVLKTFLTINNAIGYFLSLSLANRKKMIGFGGSRKAEGYDVVNEERHEIEHRIESLKGKVNAIEQVLYAKNAETRYSSRESGIMQ